MNKQRGELYIVGVGPGCSVYLTMQAKQFIEQSDVVAGYELSLNAVRGLLNNKRVLLETVENRDEILDIVAKEREMGKDCSILRVGDPCYSSGIKELLGQFKDAQVIPGISSIQVAAAKLGLVLEEITVLTFHTLRGDMEITKSMLLNSLKDKRIAIVLVVADFMPQDVAGFLISGGIDPKLPVTIFENLSLENERTFRGELRDIFKGSFTYLSIMIIGL